LAFGWHQKVGVVATSMKPWNLGVSEILREESARLQVRTDSRFCLGNSRGGSFWRSTESAIHGKAFGVSMFSERARSNRQKNGDRRMARFFGPHSPVEAGFQTS
jgi:hypothetical protein